MTAQTSGVAQAYDFFTGNKALVSNAANEVAESAVLASELAHVAGATSNLQSQISSKQGNLNKETFGAYWGNGTVTAGWCKLGTFTGNGSGRFEVRLTGKSGWNDQNYGGTALLSGSTNYISADNGQIAAGCNWAEFPTPYGPVAAQIALVRAAGYAPQKFDLLVLLDANYAGWLVEVSWVAGSAWQTGIAWQQTDPGTGSNVVKPSKRTVWDTGNFDPSTKSNTGHGHAISDVTGLQTSLDSKAAASHSHNVKDLSWSTENYEDVLNHVKNGITDGSTGASGIFGSWEYRLKLLHSNNPADWQFILAADFFNDRIGYRRKQEGTWQAPVYLWDSSDFSASDVTNWSQAYAWGDHAAAGYLKANQTITLSGDVSGSGTTGISVTVAKINVTEHSANNTEYPVVWDNTSRDLYHTAAKLKFNPSLGRLTATAFAGPLTGNASTATTLQTSRTFALTGVITATAVSFNGSGNVSLATAIADGALSIAKTSGLQAALDGKVGTNAWNNQTLVLAPGGAAYFQDVVAGDLVARFGDSTKTVRLGVFDGASGINNSAIWYTKDSVGVNYALRLSTAGLRFADNAFGGTGDTAGMRLVQRSGEDQSLEIYCGNDITDWVNFIGADNNFVKVNGNSVWNAGNFTPGDYILKAGDSGIGTLLSADDKYTKWRKDVAVSSSSNTAYASAPVQVERLATSGVAYAAGIGFHNRGTNAAFLYYDPVSSTFGYNRHLGPIVKFWDDSNLNPYQMNLGTLFEGSDPFSSRSSYDGRGGVRTGTGVGPFGNIWYNMVDVRHRNTWSSPSDIWGGELVWGMTSSTNRMSFRSRGSDGTPTAWTEVSTVGHGHMQNEIVPYSGNNAGTGFYKAFTITITAAQSSAHIEVEVVSPTKPENRWKWASYKAVISVGHFSSMSNTLEFADITVSTDSPSNTLDFQSGYVKTTDTGSSKVVDVYLFSETYQINTYPRILTHGSAVVTTHSPLVYVGATPANLVTSAKSAARFDYASIDSLASLKATFASVITSNTQLVDGDALFQRVNGSSNVTLTLPLPTLGKIFIVSGETADTGAPITEAITPAFASSIRYVSPSTGACTVIGAGTLLQVKGRCVMLIGASSTQWRVIGGIQ